MIVGAVVCEKLAPSSARASETTALATALPSCLRVTLPPTDAGFGGGFGAARLTCATTADPAFCAAGLSPGRRNHQNAIKTPTTTTATMGRTLRTAAS